MPTLMIVQVELGQSLAQKRDGTALTALERAAVNRINIPLTRSDDTTIPPHRQYFKHWHLPGAASDGDIPDRRKFTS